MAEPMSYERREEILSLHAAATEGPWWFDEDEHCWRLHGVFGRIPVQGVIPEQVMNKQILKAPKIGTPYAEYWPAAADAAFIAAAWTVVGELLAENQRLGDELDAAQSSGDRSWGREHELLADLDEGRRIARALYDPKNHPADTAEHLELEELPGWLTAETGVR